jgi:hypothetical protein
MALSASAMFITLFIVVLLLYSVRGYWPGFGLIILVSVTSIFILLPLGLLALLVKLLFLREFHDAGQYGTISTLFGKVTHVRPMWVEQDTTSSVSTLIAPTEKSRPYLAVETAYRAMERAGIHLGEPEDEPLEIEPPQLRVVGGEYESLTDEESRALRSYKDGNTGRASLAKDMKITQHKATQLITTLKAKGLVK